MKLCLAEIALFFYIPATKNNLSKWYELGAQKI